MGDFEAILKVVVIGASVIGIPAVLYLGFRWALAGIRMLEVENAQTEGSSGKLAADIDALRLRVAEIEDTRARVLELEERVDFAERLLAQEREPQRLPPGGR